jgi:hypothetical protein
LHGAELAYNLQTGLYLNPADGRLVLVLDNGLIYAGQHLKPLLYRAFLAR